MPTPADATADAMAAAAAFGAAAAEPTAGRIAPPITVRLFGALREAMGWSRRELADARTPAAIWRQLGLAQQAGDGLPAGVRVAVNHHFAHPETPLHPGDEVAFLPPISGG
jgi:molybdopterin synthase sulfur carrier subunit